MVDEYRQAGFHKVEFDIGNIDDGKQTLSSGVYVYRLTAGDFSISKKMILLK